MRATQLSYYLFSGFDSSNSMRAFLAETKPTKPYEKPIGIRLPATRRESRISPSATLPTVQEIKNSPDQFCTSATLNYLLDLMRPKQ
jgi:hypothetical protein